MVKPAIGLFIAAPSTIDRGDNAILTWNSIGADTVTLTSFGTVTNSGARTVSPSSTTTYTLAATNSEGTTSESRTITVIQPPTPPTPPPPSAYNLTFYTIPDGCSVHIIGGETKITNYNGYCRFYNLNTGAYTWEVSKTGYITESGGTNLNSNKTEYVTLEVIPPTPPPPSECPSFWEDPIGWTLCIITNGFSEFANWFGGAFWGYITAISDWLNMFGSNLAAFINDPVTKIKDWMGDTWATITEVTSSISTGITAWWSTTSANIGDWWNSATESAVNWVNGIAGTLGDIITHSWSEVVDIAGGAISDFVDWTNEQLLSIWEGIQGWAGEMILGLIDSFQFGFNQGVEEQKNERKK